MKRHVSKHRQPWLRTAIYSFMTLTVTVIVALLMLVVLGYSFDEKDGRLEQGGLLQFSSIPTGATVTLDELRLGPRTNTKSTVRAGSHNVSFERDGYRTWTKTIKITPGQVGWLNYARLIPTTINTESLHSFAMLTDALPSPERKYMLLHEVATDPTFTLTDIQGDTLRYDQLVLPEESYTLPSEGKPHSFELVSWSNNTDSILIKHLYNDAESEWILLDRGSPEESVNINKLFGVKPNDVRFAGNGDRLLFVRTDDTVRRINIDEQTLSRPLANNVDTFTTFEEKTVLFTTKPDDKQQRTVSYSSIDESAPVTIATYPADGKPLFASMGTYFNQRYLATVYDTTLIIQRGSLPTKDDKGSLKAYAAQIIPEGASNLTNGRNSRFFAVQLPDGYAVYDLELKKYDKTTWANPTDRTRSVQWLDDYMIWSDIGGELRTYEFDGANQQIIMPVAEGFAAAVSPNDKYIYAIAKVEENFELRRAQLLP